VHEKRFMQRKLEAEMVAMERSLAQLAALIVLGAGWTIVAAQTAPQDGIDRSLLQREQQTREFHVRLYDTPRANGQSSTSPFPPVPHSFIGRAPYDAPPITPAGGAVTAATPPDETARQQLDDSQLRRQLELQTQNRFLDDPTRQQQSQIQQLQFGRENQAQQLQQQIQRDSGNLMQRLH
jgi:hypothetical protein